MPGMQDLADHNALVVGGESEREEIARLLMKNYRIEVFPGARDDDLACISVGSLLKLAALAHGGVAPDLLEALIAVRDRTHTPDLWEQVNAAIAKATGGAQ